MTHSIASNKIIPRDYCRFCNYASNKIKSSIPPLFAEFEVLTPADKAEGFARKFCLNFSLASSGVTLHDFSCRTESLLSDIHGTQFMLSAIISKPCLHIGCEHFGILAILLKKCASELSPRLSNPHIKCSSPSCCYACWKSYSVVPVFKYTGEPSAPYNYCPIRLLLFCKVL